MWVLTTEGQYLNISDARKFTVDRLTIRVTYSDGQQETIAVIPEGEHSNSILKRCLEILQMQLHYGKGFNDFSEAVRTTPISNRDFVSRRPKPRVPQAID